VQAARVENHDICGDVEHVARHMRSEPREGYDVVLEVFLPGRGSLGVAAVGTRRVPGEQDRACLP